ncbi:MAG: pyridoxal-phosphate dependent enzyme [Bacteroidota bacterium]
MRAGITTQIPKIIGVQAANCSPLYEAFNQDLPAIPEITTQPSLAEGIAIKTPVRGLQMIHYVELTSGKFLVVKEAEIKDTLFLLGKKGFFVEPTSAAVIAGVRQYLQQEAHSAETIVSVLTGAGLKATTNIQQLLASS